VLPDLFLALQTLAKSAATRNEPGSSALQAGGWGKASRCTKLRRMNTLKHMGNYFCLLWEGVQNI